MNFSRKLIVKPGTKVDLTECDPADRLGLRSKTSVAPAIEKHIARLAELQYLLYAENKRSVLVVIQAVDAGGKDGTIRHVMTGLNPQGCSVTPFKVPSKGEIGIFNRSHYEEVLVVRVHKLVPEPVWAARYEQINAFEKILVENGVTILKFFLHIGKDEQKRRIQARIDDPARNWKLSESDFQERKCWNDYRKAFEDALSRCSTPWAPWYVIPAERKWVRNYAVSRILVETLEAMKMKFPPPSMDIAKVRLE
jgi:PPK2 family polyphosphate:nucleotide phosphotransferase